MHNLSSVPLSSQEKKVLGYGLGFVPTPKYNALRTRIDIFRLVRQLNLRAFFWERGYVKPNNFRTLSTFIPNVNDSAIQSFEKIVLRDVTSLEQQQKRVYYNLTEQDRQVLSNLASKKDIIIKPADKGGGLVILNRKDYESEVYRQLREETFYRKLQNYPTSHFSNLLRVVLQEALDLDYIDHDLMKFLYNEHPRTPVFYVLPKIHKPGFPTVGRPIVAAQGSLHGPVSKYIDSFLQPFVKHTRSFSQDTTDFISKIEGVSVPIDSLILSFNVVSLYTNIPHEELREVLHQCFDKREIPHPLTHFLLDFLDFAGLCRFSNGL